MKKAAAWLIGFHRDMEKNFDSVSLSFRNQKFSLLRCLIFSVSLIAIGYILCYAQMIKIP